MEYADVVLAGIVTVIPLATAVPLALGASGTVSVGLGSLSGAAVILHALFVNPPERRGPG